MHYSKLLKLLSTLLLTRSVPAYDMHCSCRSDEGTIADLTNECCSLQKANFQISYAKGDAECSNDVTKFDIDRFAQCCDDGKASTSCWAIG
ncbi:uncharacterized protein RAG0_00307 [Rhynchosporium agropyri]|uniref:Extracellular membrane protein CFEM domain-containing protein n=1 Tax=Rhynchosporium agropyri TaxID=914238 RepID=A0A1E1JS88_9HELO|nr:uncharacterized protein RAG0_00307 [Rhynchosporium agropyri]